jgi:DNA polymerase-1
LEEIDLQQTVMLIDGNSLINRAFFGLAGRNRLTAPDGTPTGALYAFLNMYLRFRTELDPDLAIAAFDRKEPTFRHDLYDGYKASRKGMPDDLAVQLPLLKGLLPKLGVAQIEQAGFEADDLIGTLATQAADQGWNVVILTGDKDSFQLVSDRVTIWQPVTREGKTEVLQFDPATIEDRYQITPAQFVDLKALMGDPSDNIPGVRGIGEKGAIELIRQYGSLDGVYANLESIRPTLAAKLRDNQDMAYLSQRLSRIKCDVPVAESIDELQRAAQAGMNPEELAQAFAALDFRSLIGRFGLDQAKPVRDSVPKPRNILEARLPDLANALGQTRGLIVAISVGPNGELAWFAQPSAESAGITPKSAEASIHRLPAADLPAAWRQLEQASCMIACYDYKKIMRAFRLPRLNGLVHDVLIGAYLLNQLDGKPDFERLYGRATGQSWPYPPFLEQAEEPVQSNLVQPDLFSLDQGPIYSAEPEPLPILLAEETPVAAAAIATMADAQQQKVAERQIERLAFEIEMKLTPLLAEMEQAGFAIDRVVLETLADSMQMRIDELQTQIFDLSGKTFNLQSPKQLGSILFEHLGLTTGKKRSGGNFSTDSEELERLIGQHPVIAPIIEHRLIAKLRSTFVEGLRKAIDNRDGRVHTTFNQVLTATGRLSSTDPNLQNIPIRSEYGNQIRSAFIASPGYVLLDADYSQIELRLLAHLSDDPAMLAAFNNDEDIHLNTACHIFGLPPEMITSSMRAAAKTVNFSIVYGISDFGLARDLGVTVKQAHQYIEGYNQQYPQVRAFLEQQVQKAYDTGYVETLFGRRRYLPELQSANRNLRQFGERAAMNAPIQGTAADLIKLAMVRARDLLVEQGLQSRLVLQVHDELIVEAPLSEADQAGALLKQAMEDALVLKVPLIAQVHRGSRWSDCKG